MKRILSTAVLCLGCTLPLLAAAQAAPAAAPATAPAAEAVPASEAAPVTPPAPAVAAAAPQAPRLICTDEKPTGSRMSRRVCRTAEGAALQQKGAKEVLETQQRRLLQVTGGG